MSDNNIRITGSFSFSSMSAIFIRDPDRNVIELDAYASSTTDDGSAYADNP